MLALYTFILDYAGGTYLRQVKAGSVPAAIKKWAIGLDISYIKGIGPKAKELLIRDLGDHQPVAIETLTNMWCVSCIIRDKLALIHIVKTEAS